MLCLSIHAVFFGEHSDGFERCGLEQLRSRVLIASVDTDGVTAADVGKHFRNSRYFSMNTAVVKRGDNMLRMGDTAAGDKIILHKGISPPALFYGGEEKACQAEIPPPEAHLALFRERRT